MENSPFYTIKEAQFDVTFILGADDDSDTVENIDAEVVLADGTRWSATFLTLHEISRIMDRWSTTGESLHGAYFQCPDLVITRKGGIDAMVDVLREMIETGGPEGKLGKLT
ncbi:hypothetical protein [Streptomyces monomycini]|uniref:hypothetical protein n=1 Tax=Streptomyces monomycini TaxID=371720 RepID=UPI0004ABA9CF|nr:hypothetical protein [Streptomyces monomycini]